MGLIGKIVGAVLVLVLIIVGVLWLYGSPPAAQATDSQGWQASESEKRYGIVTVTTWNYEAPAGAGGGIVATAPDLPLLDEGRYSQDIVKSVAQKKGIELTETGTNPFSVTKLGITARGVYYDANIDGATGRAVVVDYPCPNGDGYLITVGYGATQLPTPYWNQAQDLLKSVTCGA